MYAEAHTSIVLADVRAAQLPRHRALEADRGRAYALASGLGLPRTWSYANRAALDGFAEALAEPGGDGAERLSRSFALARTRLVEACNALIEREAGDAALAAVLLDGGGVHVRAVGAGRVYLHRKGQPQRLTSREPEGLGLLDGTPAESFQMLEPGDLILVGSDTAFSARSVGRVATVLQTDAKTPPAVLASLLTEPAAKAGAGAGAIAMRVR